MRSPATTTAPSHADANRATASPCAARARISPLGLETHAGGPLRDRIVRRLAWRAFANGRAEAEWRAARRVEGGVAGQVERAAAPRLDAWNRVYRDYVRGPLLRRGLFPHTLRVSTTAHNSVWCTRSRRSSKKLKAPAMWSYYNWIRNNVAANTPWDVFVRKILTAQGSTLENGAANFYVLHEDPRLMAETTSQAFLGMSVNCAKCHNHPMEKWTNKQYYKFANLFARVRAKTGANDGDDIIFVSNSGDIVQPLTGKRQPPAPLDGNPLPFDDPQDRREALADWLTSPNNAYFGRSIVNRIWANFFGVGIVDPVDDLRATNPASNEKLLSAAAKYLAD